MYLDRLSAVDVPSLFELLRHDRKCREGQMLNFGRCSLKASESCSVSSSVPLLQAVFRPELLSTERGSLNPLQGRFDLVRSKSHRKKIVASSG